MLLLLLLLLFAFEALVAHLLSQGKSWLEASSPSSSQDGQDKVRFKKM